MSSSDEETDVAAQAGTDSTKWTASKQLLGGFRSASNKIGVHKKHKATKSNQASSVEASDSEAAHPIGSSAFRSSTIVAASKPAVAQHEASVTGHAATTNKRSDDSDDDDTTARQPEDEEDDESVRSPGTRPTKADWRDVGKKSNTALLKAVQRAVNTKLLSELQVGEAEEAGDLDDDADEGDGGETGEGDDGISGTADGADESQTGDAAADASPDVSPNGVDADGDGNGNDEAGAGGQAAHHGHSHGGAAGPAGAASSSSLPTSLLSSPELASDLLRLRALEEKLKRKEVELGQREAAVKQVDARQKAVHQLRARLDAREKEITRRENQLKHKEKSFDEQVKSAAAEERAKLSTLLADAETLVSRLNSDVEGREKTLRELETEYEPKMMLLASKEKSLMEMYKLQVENLERRESEMAAMMVLVRDAAAQFRLPSIASHAGEVVASMARKDFQSGSSVLTSIVNAETLQTASADSGVVAGAASEHDSAAASSTSAAATAPASPSAEAAMSWLSQRFDAQQAAIAAVRSRGVHALNPLPFSVVLQAQAQAHQFQTLASPRSTTSAPFAAAAASTYSSSYGSGAMGSTGRSVLGAGGGVNYGYASTAPLPPSSPFSSSAYASSVLRSPVGAYGGNSGSVVGTSRYFGGGGGTSQAGSGRTSPVPLGLASPSGPRRAAPPVPPF